MKNFQVLLWELGQIEIGVGTLVTTNERIDAAVLDLNPYHLSV